MSDVVDEEIVCDDAARENLFNLLRSWFADADAAGRPYMLVWQRKECQFG